MSAIRSNSEPGPWTVVAGASRPPGAPEDDRRPISLEPPLPLPQHVVSIRDATRGSRWRTTVPLRLADPRANRYQRLLTLVPPAVGETRTQHWIDPGTELVLLEARDDRQHPEVLEFERVDPATFYLHFGFWAYCTYRIETGPWSGATIIQALKDGDNLPPSSWIAHATIEPLLESHLAARPSTRDQVGSARSRVDPSGGTEVPPT